MDLPAGVREQAMRKGREAGTLIEQLEPAAEAMPLADGLDDNFDLRSIPKAIWNKVAKDNTAISNPDLRPDEREAIIAKTIRQARAEMLAQQSPAIAPGVPVPVQPAFTAPIATQSAATPVEVVPAQPVSLPAVGPPKYLVSVEELGSRWQYEAYYHQIIGTESCLVLVSDNRVTGYPKMVFRAPEDGDEENRPLAMRIAGDDKVYTVQPTKYMFELDNYTVMVLEIVNLDARSLV
jgi:hypothetical protein